MKKIYVVGTMKYYANFIKDYELTSDLSEADIVLFTGGEDVSPSLYGAKKHPTTFCNLDRDIYESKVFHSIKPNQLVIGICRGSQFLCAINGGKLVQNVENHAIWGTHAIYSTNSKEVYDITSTHHQMQYPYNLKDSEYDLLYVAYEDSPIYEGDFIDSNIIKEKGEPEIVRYHVEGNPVCIAIQGHPEMMSTDAPVVEMLNKLINETLSTIK